MSSRAASGSEGVADGDGGPHEKVSAQGERLIKVEDALEQTIKIALGKAISPWQVPGILAVCVALIGVLMAAFNWAGHQPWFPQ